MSSRRAASFRGCCSSLGLGSGCWLMISSCLRSSWSVALVFSPRSLSNFHSRITMPSVYLFFSFSFPIFIQMRSFCRLLQSTRSARRTFSMSSKLYLLMWYDSQLYSYCSKLVHELVTLYIILKISCIICTVRMPMTFIITCSPDIAFDTDQSILAGFHR